VQHQSWVLQADCHHSAMYRNLMNGKKGEVYLLQVRNSRGIAPLILNLSTWLKSLFRHHALAALPRKKDSGTHWTGGWRGPGTGLNVLKKKKNLTLLEFEPRIVQHVVLSLYWLSYKGSNLTKGEFIFRWSILDFSHYWRNCSYTSTDSAYVFPLMAAQQTAGLHVRYWFYNTSSSRLHCSSMFRKINKQVNKLPKQNTEYCIMNSVHTNFLHRAHQ
jgi:hypothetical protein